MLKTLERKILTQLSLSLKAYKRPSISLISLRLILLMLCKPFRIKLETLSQKLPKKKS